jgi:hypothetical protein
MAICPFILTFGSGGNWEEDYRDRFLDFSLWFLYGS